MNLQAKNFLRAKQAVNPKMLATLLFLTTFSVLGWEGYQVYRELQLITSDSDKVAGKVQRQVAKEEKAFAAREVAELNLFGVASLEKAAQVETKPALDIKSLPETKLNLTLRGAVINSGNSSGNQESHALISSGRKKEERYLLNDMLPGGVTLYAINTDSVVLKKGKVLETLSFKRDLGSAGSVAMAMPEEPGIMGYPEEPNFEDHDIGVLDADAAQTLMENMGVESPEQMIEAMQDSANRGELDMSNMDSIRERLNRLREMRALR